MAFRRRMQCFICPARSTPALMPRIDRPDDEIKREIAILRRDAANRPPINITDQTRVCANCNISIQNEIRMIEEDPGCLRLNVLTQRSSHSCFICNEIGIGNLSRLTVNCRVDIFIKMNIYVSENTKSCQNHLNEDGLLLRDLLLGLRFINRPYLIKGRELQIFLQEFRITATKSKYDNVHDLTDEEFETISPVTKNDFQELFAFCDPVNEGDTFRNVTKKHLLTFLCKIRQGLSDEFLTFMFGYSSRQNTSMAIATVRRSLVQRFVPQHIGFNAITRDQFIATHVTPFANELYNNDPQVPKAISYIDATYCKVEKSSCFRILRQSYSMHKKYHLIKPTLIVAPNGYILSIHGPYFTDSRNNDASILQAEFERDTQNMREWYREGDIMILDRGYRDIVPFLEELGIRTKIPPFLQANQRQFSTEEANESRLITKTRWVIEARNGHLKSIFKFLDGTISVVHAANLGDFYRIAGAIINRFRGPIHMEGATPELAREILRRTQEINILQARVEVDNLRNRNARWRPLNHHDLEDFPHLTLDYVRNVAIGVYQVQLAPSYIQDKLQHEDNDVFEFDELIEERGLLRVRVYSRFSNATRHQLWIAYNQHGLDRNDRDNQGNNEPPILSYYCTCKAGARTLGCCAHVASVLWFLGYARHNNNVQYPSINLLHRVQDAGNRPMMNENPMDILNI